MSPTNSRFGPVAVHQGEAQWACPFHALLFVAGECRRRIPYYLPMYSSESGALNRELAHSQVCRKRIRSQVGFENPSRKPTVGSSMASLQQEYERIQSQLAQTSRFFRVALHVHSPESHDFGRTGDKALNSRKRLCTPVGKQEYLLALQKHLDLVALTDHMKCAYAVALSSLPSQRADFAILPGMEINVRLLPPLDSKRIHVLAIFPPGTAVDHINRIFAGTDVDCEEKRDPRTSEVKDVNLHDFVSRIKEAKGICILAHVESSPTGIRCLWHQTAKDVLGLLDRSGQIPLVQLQEVSEKFKTLVAELEVSGVEVSRPEDRKHYSWIQDRNGRKRNVPVLLSLDAHSIEDLAGTERHCHVKMTSVSFEGLQAALKMPHTRIRFKHDLPTPPSPALLGITLSSPAGGGFFRDATIAFSDNLNCIIGARGSGKSTVIDALRYVFGYNRTLEELEDGCSDQRRRIHNKRGSKD
jgi:PHP family Zn ribbon phosphoesterase